MEYLARVCWLIADYDALPALADGLARQKRLLVRMYIELVKAKAAVDALDCQGGGKDADELYCKCLELGAHYAMRVAQREAKVVELTPSGRRLERLSRCHRSLVDHAERLQAVASEQLAAKARAEAGVIGNVLESMRCHDVRTVSELTGTPYWYCPVCEATAYRKPVHHRA